MIADATVCEWSAGRDRYVGSIPAAIAAYRFPAAIQAELIAQWQERRWVDVVVIDRDSIRGRTGDYRPDLAQMNFGGKGRRCERVSREKWSDSQAETAIVLCADGECVAVPSVCSNVSRITRINRSAPIAPLAYLDGADAPRRAGPLGTGPGFAAAIPLAPVIAQGQGGYAGGSWGAAAGFGYAIAYLPSDCACCGVPVAPAVPEPMTAALIAAGLGFVVAVTKRAERDQG